jgi:hypothetical protein
LFFIDAWRNKNREAFFRQRHHLQMFGEVKDIDMPELRSTDMAGWSMNYVDRKRRCALCSTASLDLIFAQGKDEEGRSVLRVDLLTITINSEGAELAPLLPSFNRMALNCLQSTCGQCFLVLKTLISAFSTDVLSDKTYFDRGSLIQCSLTPPIGTSRQYMNLLSEEVLKQSSRPPPAPELTIRPPHKCKTVMQTPYKEIRLLIESTSLPLPNMQGSGRFINSDGVDLALAKNWWEQVPGGTRSGLSSSPKT